MNASQNRVFVSVVHVTTLKGVLNVLAPADIGSLRMEGHAEVVLHLLPTHISS